MRSVDLPNMLLMMESGSRSQSSNTGMFAGSASVYLFLLINVCVYVRCSLLSEQNIYRSI